MGLTVKKVARLTRPGRYLDSDGLYLQVLNPINRSWLLRYELRRKKRWMGLGSVETFSLEEARQRARRARQLLADKIDPLEARRAERAEQAAAAARAKTFAAVVDEYFDAHADSWSNRKHRADFLSSLKSYAYPLIGNLPVAAIDEALVLGVLQPIWRDKIVTAQRLMRRIANVLDFAAAAKYRTGANPARWKGHLEHLLAAPERLASVKHHHALPYAELPDFISQLRNVEGVAARALEFAILTAARSDEARLATWDEIDLKNAIWIVPPQRMKARREHRVALAQQTIALLRALPREDNFVFVGAKKGAAIGDNALRHVLRRLRPEATVHGFRASFKTWCEERTSFPNIIVEQSLAHVVGNATERAYRRTDLLAQRQRLMQSWADYCDGPSVARKVTPLRRARS